MSSTTAEMLHKFAFQWGHLSLTHPFSVISEIIAIDHTLPYTVIQDHYFWYQWKASKPMWLCANNSNSHLVLHRFRDMADYCSSFRCREGDLFLTHSFGVNP